MNKRHERKPPPNDPRAWGETAHIQQGTHKGVAHKPMTFRSVAVSIVLPFVVFGLVNVSFMFVYHHYMDIMLAVLVGLGLTFGVGSIALKQIGRGGMAYIFFLCALAMLTGTIVGYYNYVHIILPFWEYYEHRRYTNVMPDELASAHTDAAALVFAQGTRPDVTRPVGYVTNSHTYCVAPITIRGAELSTSDVQYWAAGKDCCHQRSDFRCGSAQDHAAHAGIVMSNTPHFIDIERRRDLAYYREAVAMAEASYGMTSATMPIFVHWVSDIEFGLAEIFADSWLFFCESLVVYGAVSVVFGFGVHGAK